jgi:hypothetical protein
VPDYLLFAAYGLLAIGVVGCLAYIANSFEDENSAPRRPVTAAYQLPPQRQRLETWSGSVAHFFFCAAPGAMFFAPPGSVCTWPGARSFAPPGAVCDWPGVD